MLAEYSFKFYLNARHYMTMDGKRGNIHSHTWEICVRIVTDNSDFFQFSVLEKNIEDYIDRFDGTVLNDCEVFSALTPSLENLGRVMFGGISNLLLADNWFLKELAISENPTRTYVLKAENSISHNTSNMDDVLVILPALAPESLAEDSFVIPLVQDLCFPEKQAPDTQEILRKPRASKAISRFAKGYISVFTSKAGRRMA